MEIMYIKQIMELVNQLNQQKLMTFSLNQDNDDKVTKNKERRCSR